jgi:hypothetical protein
MAHIDYIEGSYTIPRGETQLFDFWWPDGKSNEYFDVSIAVIGGVDQDGDVVPDIQQLRLREVGREMLRMFDEKYKKPRYVLRLTITNEEPLFDVTFIANHVRIY